MRIILGILFAATSLFAAGPSFATYLNQSNFDAENGGTPQLNYYGLQNFNVTTGSVDLIGNGYFDFGGDNSNLYVDMAGSTHQYGALTTKNIFGPGTYQVTLNIGGTIYAGMSDGVSVSWAGCGASCYSTGALAGLSSEIEKFNVKLTSASAFTIADLGLSGNTDIGATLFGFNVVPVPEPASIALLGAGLAGIGGWRLRRKAKTA